MNHEKKNGFFNELNLGILIGADAVRPFMTEAPAKAYEHTTIDKDVMFGVTSQVYEPRELLSIC